VSSYHFPEGAPGQPQRRARSARRPVPLVVAILALAVLLCATVAVFYVVLFDPFGLSFETSGRCTGMSGHQQELCERFASTHQSQVPAIRPDREPLPSIIAPEK
jgi:hypothetical protein